MRLHVSPTTLARSSARHPWRTIAAWIAAIGVAIFLVGSLLGDSLSTDVTTMTNNPESTQADALLRERLGDTASGEIVVLRSTSMTVDDPAYRAFADTLLADLTALGSDLVTGGTNYFQSGDESLVSGDRMTTLMPLQIADGVTTEITRVHDVVGAASPDGAFRVLVTGQATLDAELKEVAEKDLSRGESIGLPVALFVLAIVFGAVVAAFLPILLAIVAVLMALGGVALLGQAMELPFAVINIMTMLGLAVGIDYSLFVVSRYREERARGVDKIEAIANTGGSAGRTVIVSGLTVALALGGMMIMPDSSSHAIGAGGAMVVLAAVFTSMTLLPALLSLIGDKVNKVRIPFVQRPTGQIETGTGGFWGWTTATVMRRPVISLVIAVGILLAAASSMLDMRQGEVGVEALPDGLMSRDAYVILEQEFGFGQDLPAIVVIDGQTDAAAVVSAVADLEAKIATDPSFAAIQRETHPDADLTVLTVRLTGDALGDDALAAIERLRDEHIPAAFADSPAEVLVTGKTAKEVDLTAASETYTPIVFIFVLGLSFLLLTVAFRSIVVPVKAILMNLLSVGAAYGTLVLVFQKGVGAELLGFEQVDVIQTGLPLFLFAVLFGLSMDYHVFLLSRVRERFLETGDNDEAVAYGLRSTSRLITGAALIMVAVFSGFALGDIVPMQQMGFGLAVAVLIDATIIRTVLVPASMRLLGRWNWYLPNFLNWLPELRLESPVAVEATAAD